MEPEKTPNSQRNVEKENQKLAASQLQTSSSITKLSSARQYGTGTKTDI